MNLDFNAITQNTITILTNVGLKVIGAIVIWLVGRWLIGLAVGLAGRALDRQILDKTIVSYVRASLSALLTIALIVALLGFFGVETTTFAALLAGVGIAIGAAWSGLLANFAAGVFLVILRPFKVGDFVTAGGMTGTVQAIGLFGTTLNTPDNVQTILGNGKIFSDTIQNFSTNPFRRVDVVAQLDHAADHTEAIQLLKDGLSRVPNVLPNPAPEVEILQFNLSGPVLTVRPYCNNAHYWQVYFDTNRLIKESFRDAGYTPPEHRFLVRGVAS
ncbi:MAG TPA: mechanosensitive ion channel family protein [Bryobacteraceae bacterium]|jgi:small conductance mechanosensitive channel|nr:mechanosensitive ion channel family protein [Bryobacteraceae bacterium]